MLILDDLIYVFVVSPISQPAPMPAPPAEVPPVDPNAGGAPVDPGVPPTDPGECVCVCVCVCVCMCVRVCAYSNYGTLFRFHATVGVAPAPVPEPVPAPAPIPAPAPGAGGPCGENAVLIERNGKRFCIDKYEYPNRPVRMRETHRRADDSPRSYH
mgnify:CR=1 FL=1